MGRAARKIAKLTAENAHLKGKLGQPNTKPGVKGKVKRFGTSPGMTAAANYAQVGGAVSGVGIAAHEYRKNRVARKAYPTSKTPRLS